MSDNFYTTKTASLKATTADIRNLNAKQIKLNDKNILDYISDSEFNSYDTRDLQLKNDELDIWNTTISLSDNGHIEVKPKEHSYDTISSTQSTTIKSAIKLIDDKVLGADDTHLMYWQTDGLTNGYGMFYGCKNLTSFSSDLSSLTSCWAMFYGCSNLTSFKGDLSSLTDGNYMFRNCTNLTSFSSDLHNLTNGSGMFSDCTNLETFSSDLPSLTYGKDMFNYCTNLETFSSDLPSLTYGYNMFSDCTNLTSFSSDLSNLTDGFIMFSDCTKLTSFTSNLASLTNGSKMFDGCKLDTASIQNIADTINTPQTKRIIDIGIGNSIPNEQEEEAFNTIASKNWTVFVGVNGGRPSEWRPTSLTPIDGEETTTPIPFWAKPVQSDEEHAQYVDAEGNFYNILGGNYIYGDDLSTYGMFMSEEDAAANMRLRKIEKP